MKSKRRILIGEKLQEISISWNGYIHRSRAFLEMLLARSSTAHGGGEMINGLIGVAVFWVAMGFVVGLVHLMDKHENVVLWASNEGQETI